MIGKEEAVVKGLAVKGRVKLLPEELGWLYELASLAPDGTACEVGVYCGGSLIAWACARIGRGKIVAVDNVDRPELLENIAEFGHPIRFVKADSWDAAAMIEGDLAFCFIDAEHGIDGFPKDILPYAAKMMPGGIIVYHDYAVWKQTIVVKRYVDAWQSLVGWEELGNVRSAIAFRRPRR